MNLEKPITQQELLRLRQKHFLPTAFLYYQDPLIPVRAEGSQIWDLDGKRYIDAIGGIVCISAGHHVPHVKKQLLSMLEENEIQHTSTIYLSPYSLRLAEALSKKTQAPLSRVSLTNSGSEANELAFLLARQFTGEATIVHLEHSYHGGSSATLAACGQKTWRFSSLSNQDCIAAPAPYCYRCPFGKKPNQCALECVDGLERTLETQTHGKIAAFIAEPILGVGGFIDPPPEYFQRASELIRHYGGLYISDEVQTGMGRGGEHFYMSDTYKVQPDMITLAKGLGNGAPIGAVLTSDPVASSVQGKIHFNTFGGDPLQSAQALATIETIEQENLIKNALKVGKQLKLGFQEFAKRFPFIGDVRGRGLLIGLELVENLETKEHSPQKTIQLMEYLKNEGVLVGKGGLYGNVIRIAPPLSLTHSEAQEILRAFEKSLDLVQNQSF